ncbi:hypothetical protein BBP40_006229 [Aspergillus hancockii]|nr:hypothetical protein BBP40_006229 [Aspergillus hancockii]
MSVRWQRLRLTKQEAIPPLLFKYSSTSKGYKLYITDLTHIWSEDLNRQEILKKADEHDTTIDPSEDPEQFEVLLRKIGDALCNQPGSTVNLKLGSGGDSLDLFISTKLPAPLQSLKWVAHLLKEPQSFATSQLLLPLVRAEADWQSHQRSLIDQLHKKDWVLTKLFDKIEAVGIDLSTIFPGISGLRTGKGTTLAQAAKHIKGVAPFDENDWFEAISTSSAGSGLAANIFAEASSSNSSRVVNPAPDEWWGKLTIIKTTKASTREESEPKTGPKPSKDSLETDTETGTETEDDDEFERTGRLGVIGGKPSKRDVESTPIRQAEEGNSRKLGETAKHSSESTESPTLDTRPPKTSEQLEQPEQPEQPRSEETNDEKVDRKREELRRQLEAKSKAPARKKRKF